MGRERERDDLSMRHEALVRHPMAMFKGQNQNRSRKEAGGGVGESDGNLSVNLGL